MKGKRDMPGFYEITAEVCVTARKIIHINFAFEQNIAVNELILS